MAREDKLYNAVVECYRRLFKASTPSADFDSFDMANVPFLDHKISKEDSAKIINGVLDDYKIIRKFEKRMVEVTVLLGCSPTYSD